MRFPDQPAPYLVTNFVASIDGVVSLGKHDGTDASGISGYSPADRFVMGMLRAAADVIVVGARTLNDSPGHQWTPEKVARGFGDELHAYRRALGRPETAAPLVIVSGRGHLEAHAAITEPAVPTTVLTTNLGSGVERAFPRVRRLVVGGEGHIDGATLTQTLAHEFGARLVLCEGGATLVGSLVGAGQVSELFLTIAPRLAGRDGANERIGMVEGYAFDSKALQDYAVVSARREDSTLLLRYRRG